MIGMILRNMRKLKGLKQTDVANKLRLAGNTISNYETEYSNPTFDTVYKFIDVCNFDIQFVDKDTKQVYKIDDLSKEMDF